MEKLKTIDPLRISKIINKCFVEYDPDWVQNYNADSHVNGFKYYLEHTAGLKLGFRPETKDGRVGYRLDSVEIVDDKKYTMFLLRYAA